MRVVVAVKRADVRSALRLLLTHELDMQVVDEAADSAATRAMLEASCPDLLLVDWDLLVGQPGLTVGSLRSLCPDLLVVGLSGHADGHRDAHEADLDGFISVGSSASQVTAAMRAVVVQGQVRRSTGGEQGAAVKGTP